jgi:hypothetical protein
MEEEDVGLECHRVIVGESRCDNLDVLQGWKLVMKSININGFPGVMNDTTQRPNSARIRVGIQFALAVRRFILKKR